MKNPNGLSKVRKDKEKSRMPKIDQKKICCRSATADFFTSVLRYGHGPEILEGFFKFGLILDLAMGKPLPGK